MIPILKLGFALLLAVAAAASCAAPTTATLPDTELAVLTGDTMRLGDVDEPRVINLWATWCAPCRAELPVFDELAPVAAGRSVEIVGVNIGDDADDAAALVDELGLSFTQVLDPTASVQTAMRITGMPATIFLDGDGQILDVHSGEVNRQELVDLLNTIYSLDPAIR